MTESIAPAETDYQWLADALERRPTKRRNLSIPEHAETTIIPSGKYRGVRFRNDRAPYMVRPMECLSPQSNIQEVRCMFPAQTGKSTIGEQATLYYIQEVPSEILYVSSDDNASRKWMEKRIVPRAEKLGIEFRAQSDDKSTKRTGNTIRAKEFDGGNIDAASSRSPAQLASETKRFVNADETDRWKQSLGAEGFTWDIMYARTQAWGDQKKILATSTPTTFDESLIWPLFEEGTREEYFVPCPDCGEMQTLKIDNLKYNLKKHHVWYECEKCGFHIEESKKHWFLNHGEWRKQAEPLHDAIVSFHINALYSPFKQWEEIAREYEKAKDDEVRMHTFTNLVLGMPYRETGSRPKIEKVISLRSVDYKSGQVPNQVLYLTAGADVQRGKVKYENYSDDDLEKEMQTLIDQKKNLWTSGLPRIELEVVGHGEGYRTWGIEYKIFYGSTQDINAGAWLKLSDWIESTGLEYTHLDGTKKVVNRVLIDSGYNTDLVYDFCEQYPGFLPCKGDQILKANLTEKGDEVKQGTFIPYRLSKIRETQPLITISTNHYKRKIYSSLKIPRVQGGEQRPRFMEFPRDYPDHYFAMLTNEELRLDGSFHDGGRPVEALDIRVYALTAGDICLDDWVRGHREALVKAGAPRKQAEKLFTHRMMIDRLKLQRFGASGEK